MILRKLFGGSPEALQKKATSQFEGGDYGGALLSYQKLSERLKGDAADEARANVSRCKDELARIRLAEAERLIDQGDLDMAQEELDGALEVVVGDEARAEIQDFVDSLQRDDAKERATVVDVSDEERWLLISGNWGADQSEELEAHGEDLREAILTLHRGGFSKARAVLEEMVENAEEPRYLWLEVARAQLADEDAAAGKLSLENYLEATDAEDVDEPWLGAHIALAGIADGEDDFEGAMAHFTLAVEAFEDDPRPYHAMGAFLRLKDCPNEAIDVLETAAEIGDAEQPDWRILQELGLAYRDAERHDAAIGTLEGVIDFMVARREMDYPPATAEALAQLHEKHGKMQRAADMWAALARGSNRAKHHDYHLNAARVLGELGLDEEAERMRKRGEALRPADEASAGEEE